MFFRRQVTTDLCVNTLIRVTFPTFVNIKESVKTSQQLDSTDVFVQLAGYIINYIDI